MTGYGSCQLSENDVTVKVEVKTLNSKSTDMRLKLPMALNNRELQFRKILMDGAIRGRIEATMTLETPDGNGDLLLNKKLFAKYYKEITDLQAKLGITPGDTTQAILRIQSVVGTPDDDIEEGTVLIAEETCKQAIASLDEFRLEEGKVIMQDLKERVETIRDLMPKIEPFELERIPKLRERIYKNLEDFKKKDSIDHNRFEQEILYYIEKLDISEEKVRLTQHCKYFLEEMFSKEIQIGKKLSFISQEMGREINTLGSKAQHMEIQQIVVMMKDELEKIKEQLANVL
jgi:uncharacterized protein (TIGR00255 family)